MSADRLLTAVTGERTSRSPREVDDGAAIDEWGASRLGLAIGRGLAGGRWHVELRGADGLPDRGGALLVTNHRPFGMLPPLVALVVGERLGRTVRFAGVLDVAPASLVMRRAGGILDRADEVESALRGGDLVVVGARGAAPVALDLVRGAAGRASRPGDVPVGEVGAARRARVPIFPVVAAGASLGRRLRVEVAPAVRPRLDRRGPLAVVELAERVQQRLQRGVDEIAAGR